jgi:hypothetical protein
MGKVNWNRYVAPARDLYFSDLELNESFRNKNGKGAVYTKVGLVTHRGHVTQHGMLELATGKIWEATASPVERINVEVNISAVKPSIY